MYLDERPVPDGALPLLVDGRVAAR
jgi:hypothetical protein